MKESSAIAGESTGSQSMCASKTWVLLAPGESLTQAQCDLVRGKCKVLAVGDAYRLAPWADALVHNDAHWWQKRPDTVNFPGLKFTVNPNVGHAKRVAEYDSIVTRASNSGVLGIYCARNLGAKHILLLGYDMHGSHFFGPHTDGLRNTTPSRFATFMTYFDRIQRELLSKEGIQVYNCTPGSALKVFPHRDLEEMLCRLRP